VGRSFHIGSARGISIKVHPSFALVLLWVIYQWGIVAHAGLRGVVFGTLLLLAVFGCVVLHELAHAVMAIHYGLRVRDITLLPIGGVARIEHMTVGPRAEIAIALAGPAMNLALALAILPLIALVAFARHLHGLIDVLLYAGQMSVTGFFLYLWIANILLAVFNLLPAFPMDGGRVLRAVLTHFRDRLTATRLAVIIGQVFAVLLAIFGVWIGDYMLPLVSLFILGGAYVEGRQVRIEMSLRKLDVGQFALWENGGIRPDVPVARAAHDHPRDMVVTENGDVVGMLWRHDVMSRLHSAYDGLYVRDVMDRRPAVVDVNDSLFEVFLWLSSSNKRAVAVVENGRYRGIFTVDRLAHVYAQVEHKAFRWERMLLRVIFGPTRYAWR
jgi:Zn-dependent protease